VGARGADGSSAMRADGPSAHSHESGFQLRSRALTLSACSSCLSSHLHSESGVLFCCLVLLGELELALLLEVRTGVALTQDLELGPVGAELLRETP
jgi:hypothetical protein